MNSQEELKEILKFLHGSGQLDGYWFGNTPTDRPKFWWRPKLLEAITKHEADIAARERAAEERVLDELTKSAKHYTDVTLEADALDPWAIPVTLVEAKRQALKQGESNDL